MQFLAAEMNGNVGIVCQMAVKELIKCDIKDKKCQLQEFVLHWVVRGRTGHPWKPAHPTHRDKGSRLGLSNIFY